MPLLMPSRRDLLKLAAIAPAFALPAPSYAEITPPSGLQPAFQRFTLGQAKITIVSDGHLALPTSALGVNADPAEVQAMF